MQFHHMFDHYFLVPQQHMIKLAHIFYTYKFICFFSPFYIQIHKHIIITSFITYVSVLLTSIPLISCCTLNGKDMYDQRSKWMTSVRTHLRIQYLFFRGLCLEIKRKERNTIFSSHVFCNSFISRSSLRYFYDNTIIDMFIGKIFFH